MKTIFALNDRFEYADDVDVRPDLEDAR